MKINNIVMSCKIFVYVSTSIDNFSIYFKCYTIMHVPVILETKYIFENNNVY